MAALTSTEKEFVQQFTVDMNPVLACMRMGYEEADAVNLAYDLLGKEHVKDALAQALTISSNYSSKIDVYDPKDFGVTENYIILRLKSIADRAYKDAEKIKALELLGKAIGMFKDHVKVESTVTKKSAFDPLQRAAMVSHLAKGKKDQA